MLFAGQPLHSSSFPLECSSLDMPAHSVLVDGGSPYIWRFRSLGSSSLLSLSELGLPGGRRGSCSSCEFHGSIVSTPLTSVGTRCCTRDRSWTSSLTWSFYPLVQGKTPPCRRKVRKRISTLRTHWSGSDRDHCWMGDSNHRYIFRHIPHESFGLITRLFAGMVGR